MSSPVPPSLRHAAPWVAPLAWLAAAALAWYLSNILLLVFAALLLALILRGLAAPLARRLPLSDRVALFLVVLTLLAASASALALFGTEVRSQMAVLGERLPQAWDEFSERLGSTRLGAQVRDRIYQSLDGDGGGGDIASLVGRAMATLASTLTDLILVLVGAVYFAAQPDVYWRGAIGMLPPPWRTGGKDVLTSVGRSLRRWLLAQLGAMVLVGTLVGLGCALLGLPSALALGLLAGLTEFVPVVGPAVAAIPALLLAMTISWETALWTALLYLGVQQLEGNVISPLVIRSSVAVPPAVTLFAILAFGALFGVMGVLLAAPLAVMVHVLVTEFWARRLPPPRPVAVEPATPEHRGSSAPPKGGDR
jgi:predicted PurR-regulated permease PerM